MNVTQATALTSWQVDNEVVEHSAHRSGPSGGTEHGDYSYAILPCMSNRYQASREQTGIFAPRLYLAYTQSGEIRHLVMCSRTERYRAHRALCGVTAQMVRIAPWNSKDRGVCERCKRSAGSAKATDER